MSPDWRRRLDELGAPPGDPVITKDTCCDLHDDWRRTMVGLSYDVAWDEDDALWDRVGVFGTAHLAYSRTAWLIRLLDGPTDESVEVAADLSTGTLRWTLVSSGDPARFGWLRRHGEHALLGAPAVRRGRPPGADVSSAQAIEMLVNLAQPGTPPTWSALAQAIHYSDARKLRQALRPWTWQDLCLEAARRLRPSSAALIVADGTTAPAIFDLMRSEALMTAAGRSRRARGPKKPA